MALQRTLDFFSKELPKMEKELGIAKVKQERDLEGNKYRVIVLTSDVFEWRIRNKILKVLKR